MTAPHGQLPRDGNAGYEKRDVHIRALFVAGAGIAGTVVVAFILMRLLFSVLQHTPSPSEGELSPLADPNPVPPEPRLRPLPALFLREHRAEEDRRLNGYAWVDRQAGIVRIPIDEALTLAVSNGLPAWPAAPPQDQEKP